MKTRICPSCGKEFTRQGDRAWAQTCSRSCGRRLVHGDPVERFWSHVDQSPGPDRCWPWLLSTTNGYGNLGWRGKVRKAHRVAYELTHGDIPDGVDILHDCDNPICCNPGHLFPGDQSSNMEDMRTKGRASRKFGSANGRAKLTIETVRYIRDLYATGTVPQQWLADAYNVHQATISKIVLGKSWPDES